MKKKERYYLNGSTLPTIPVPHDCVIKEIKLGRKCMKFIFEDDISYHDIIKDNRPEVKSLVMTFHFAFDVDDISLFVQSKPSRFHKRSTYKEMDLRKNRNVLAKLCGKSLEYLYHNVGFCSIIIKLWSPSTGGGSVVFDIDAKCVELEWIC